MKASVILVINPRMDVANNLQVPAEIESKINDAGSPDITEPVRVSQSRKKIKSRL